MKSITRVVITIIILFVLTITFYYTTKTLSSVTGKSIIGWIIFTGTGSQTEIDNFTKCLTEKGAKLYINKNSDEYERQLKIFGSSSQYLDIIDCYENAEICKEKNIKTNPTWIFNWEIYEGILDLEKLKRISGCLI
jgi:hypothetical protein